MTGSQLNDWNQLVSGLPEQQKIAIGRLRETDLPAEEKIAIAESVLASREGKSWSAQVARWICKLINVENFVPDVYCAWKPLISDSLQFFLEHLSPDRLARKLVDQIELPAAMPAPIRVLTLLTRMPGLQKLGQVLARNRHLDSALRSALIALENEISDVDFETVEALVRSEIGPALKEFGVSMDDGILSEGTVSAVVAFSWLDPDLGLRQRGVFKIMKPHIMGSFAQDMDLFRQLTEAIANQEDRYGLLVTYLPEVFRDVRELLAHEVDFPRERRTLREAAVSYGSIPGVRVPRVIESLSTANITAMTEESGSKITGASTPAPKRASQMLEALVLRPLLSTDRLALFHADPHAGNLFYDDSKRELIILDWALGEHLTIGQRHSLLMLSVLLALEDEEGVSRELELLGAGPGKGSQPIRELVANFLRGGTSRSFGSLSGMRLLDFLAMQGVVFPAQLMLFRKAVFTLDGVLHDIAGPDADLDAFLMTSLVELIAERWTMLFSLEDCVTLQLSWLAFLAKIGTRALVTPWIAQLSSWYGLNQSPAAILSELDTARSR